MIICATGEDEIVGGGQVIYFNTIKGFLEEGKYVILFVNGDINFLKKNVC